MKKQFISWRRVSTFKQGKSGLGLEAQKEIIRYFVERDNGELVADYSECYTGKELSECKELRKAMQHAKNIGAVLVIAKSDRFRNCQEALGILDEMGEGHLEFCDLPHSDRFTLTLFWALAEREALITSIRTKQALAALKAHGDVKLGAANEAYRASYEAKTRAERAEIGEKRGKTHNAAYLASRDTQAFVRILRRVFGEVVCPTEDVSKWSAWQDINTKADNKGKILALMRDYQAMDGGVFKKWNLSGSDKQLQSKLSNAIYVLRRAARTAKMYNEK